MPDNELDGMLVDPDQWFNNTFETGSEEFADFIYIETDFFVEYMRGKSHQDSYDYSWKARHSPEEAWQDLEPEWQQRLQRIHFDSLIPVGALEEDDWDDDDDLKPSRSVRTGAADAPAVLHTMPGDAGEMLTSPEVAAGFSRFKVIVIGGVVTVATAAIVAFSIGGGDGGDATEGSSAPVGAASVVAGGSASDGGAGSSIPPAPLVIQPCDVVDPALAASLIGTSTTPTQRGNDRSKSCTYQRPAPNEGVSLTMSVTRNTQSPGGVFRGFRASNDDPIEVRTIPWSEDGELRIRVFGTNRSTAALLAYVITSDPLGRDVYVIVSSVGPSTDGTAMAAAIETMAEFLRDAILAAQP